MLKRNDLKYYFKHDAVIVEYHNQFISFNTFALQGRKKFRDFSSEIQASPKSKYNNLNDIFVLANSYGIKAMQGYDPSPQCRLIF